MSTVTYGGVSLDLVKTNSFSQEPVYSEDGIDYLYTRFVLDVSTTFNTALNGYANQADAMATLRRTLLAPRQKLEFRLDGVDLVAVGGPDVAGGPFPRNVTVRRIDGDKLLHVSFVVEVHRLDCNLENNEYLSNRWEVTHEYDANAMCTRRTSGILVYNGKSNVPPDNAGARAFVMPKVPLGWKRESMTFSPSSNRLKLRYTIVDKEQYLVPPTEVVDSTRDGATVAQANYRQYTSQNGTIFYATMSVTLQGKKTTPKSKLYKLAAAIVLERFDFGNGDNPRDILREASIEEEIFENRVSISVTVMKTEGRRGNLGITDISKLAKKDIANTGDNIALDLGPVGTAMLTGAIAAWKSDLCEDAVANWAAGDVDQAISGTIVDEPDVSLAESEPNEIAESFELNDPNPYTSDHKASPYVDSTMNVDHETNQHMLHVPIAGSSADLSGLGGSSLDAAVNIQVARPTTKKMVDFNHARFNQHPEFPLGVDMDGADGKLLAKSYKARTPERWVDGQSQLHQVTGRLEFGLTDAVDEAVKALDAGKLAYDSSSIDGNKIPAGTAKRDFLDYTVE